MKRITIDKYCELVRAHGSSIRCRERSKWGRIHEFFRMYLIILIDHQGSYWDAQNLFDRMTDDNPGRIAIAARIARLTGYDYGYVKWLQIGFSVPLGFGWFWSRCSQASRQGYADGTAIRKADIWNY